MISRVEKYYQVVQIAFCFLSKKLFQIRYLLASGRAGEAELVRFRISPIPFAYSAGEGGAGSGAGVDVGAADADDGGSVDAGGAGRADGGGGEGEISPDGDKAEEELKGMERLVGIARDLSKCGLLVSVRVNVCMRTAVIVALFRLLDGSIGSKIPSPA